MSESGIEAGLPNGQIERLDIELSCGRKFGSRITYEGHFSVEANDESGDEKLATAVAALALQCFRAARKSTDTLKAAGAKSFDE